VIAWKMASDRCTNFGKIIFHIDFKALNLAFQSLEYHCSAQRFPFDLQWLVSSILVEDLSWESSRSMHNLQYNLSRYSTIRYYHIKSNSSDIDKRSSTNLNTKSSQYIVATYIKSIKEYILACQYPLRIMTYLNNINIKIILI